MPALACLTGAGAIFGLLQCLPVWPLQAAWAPGVARLWGELGILEPGQLAPATLSPASTLQQAAWLLLATMVVAVAPYLFSTRRAVSTLFAALALNGVVLASLMLVQLATWNGQIYWIGPELDRRAPAYGPFVYHNQAANYFGVALACLAGWWIASSHRSGSQPTPAKATRAAWLGGPRGVRVLQLVGFVVLVAGLIAAESRGGAVAAVIALGIGLLARLDRVRLGRGNQLALIGSLAIAGAIVWVIASDGPADRYATLLEDEALAGDSRLIAWNNAIATIGSIGWLGGGLGAYRHTNQAFQVEPTAYEFQNAHNQYLEALVNGGPLALGLLLAAIVVAIFQIIPASRSTRRTLGSIGLVGLIVLAFQAAHGLVDFCLYLPASFLTTALLLGLVTTSNSRRYLPSRASQPRDLPPPGWRSFAAIGLVVAMPLAAMVLQHAGSIDRELVSLQVADGRLTATDAELDSQIASLQQTLGDPGSARLLPNDGVAYEALGDLLVTRYRRAARQALAAELGLDADNPSLAPWTTPSVLFRKAHEALVSGDVEKATQLREQPLVVEHLRPAYQAYCEALIACPLLERAAVRRAELAFVEEGFDTPQRLDQLLALAQRIGGTRPGSLYALGNLALLSDRPEMAWDAWGDALRISRRNETGIAQRAAQAMPADRLVNELLPADPKRLVAIGRRALAAPSFALARAATLGKAEKLLEASEANNEFSLRPGERWALLADCRAERGDTAGAILALQSALQENPSRIEDRFALAKLLLEMGREEEALKEARFCARAKPSTAMYSKLVRQIEDRTLDPRRRAEDRGRVLAD